MSGQLIRLPVEGIRFTKRASKGVRVVQDGDHHEKVVSVERISEPESDEPEAPEADAPGDDASE